MPGTNDITLDTVTQPVTISPTTSSGTSVTVGTKTVTLSQCLAGGSCAASKTWSSVTSTSPNTWVLTDGGPTTAVVQRNQHKLRSMLVLHDASAASAVTYKLTGGSFAMGADGRVTAKDAAGEVLGQVNPSWAVDSHGAAVPTSYTVDANGLLTLHVNHTSGIYAYPVIADPSISFGRYVYIRYGKDWIRAIWPPQRWVWDLGPALCAWIPKPPFLIAACVAGVAAYLGSIRDTFNYAYDNYRCVELRVTYNGWLVGWRSYGC